MKIKITHLILLFFISNIYSQNLLNTTSWTVGTGNVADFGMYGTTQNNYRELGLNHIGQEVVLWKAIPDNLNTVDGGFTSSFKNIDNMKTYRFTVWIRKTNSQSGTTYFGCNSYASGQHQTLNLDGTTNTNPFWHGDLPHLNRWYLLVGYIHNSDYTSNINLGRIYDGTTGEEVLTISDLKFSSIAYNLRLRAFLFNATDLNVRQYLYNPRIEEINGNEFTLNRLFAINENSTIMFDYDAAGNQIKRFYCISGTSCSFPSRSSNHDPINEEIGLLQKENEEQLESQEITISPNPTSGKIIIQSLEEIGKLTDLIMVYDSKGVLIQKIIPKNNDSRIQIDLSNQSSGLYFVHMHFKNGGDLTKKIIKK